MAAVGIDIGFGFTKAYNGRDTIAFKSIFGDATDIQYREQLLGTPRAEEHLHVATGGMGILSANWPNARATCALSRSIRII